jgi:hypothetical protein
MMEREGFNIFLKEYAKISNLTIEKAEKLTKDFVEAIKKTLTKHDIKVIQLKNLGSFIVYERAERSGTLFGEKEVVTFPAKKTVKFKFSRNVKEKIEKDIKEREKKNGGVL